MTGRAYHLAIDDPKNSGLTRHLLARPREKDVLPIAAPDSAGPDPYMGRGSHPETVQRVWDQLGAALPVDCRCLLYGTPALVAPMSGVVLAAAWGTAYILRLPQEAMAQAIKGGATTVMKWTGGGATDLSEIGPDWVFGAWLKQEPDWCAKCLRSAEAQVP